MNNCEQCIVRNRAICAGLSTEELDLLAQLGRKQQVSRGQTLVWEGDEALLVANVIKGVLKLGISMPDGREQIVGVVFPSDFIGRPFGQQSEHSVTALTDAEVCVFPRKSFDEFARVHPDLEHKLLQRTLAELDRARSWMLMLGRKTASEKIATFLLELGDRLNDTGCQHFDKVITKFELPLDRQQMGDVLGLTIETVSRQLTKLKGSGMIDLPDRRSVVIKDRERLQNLATAC
jgi:CRP/FNR family transcriptional regulator